MTKPLDPFSEVVDQARRWTPDWYGWLDDLETRVEVLESGGSARIQLTSATTFYVSTGGSDVTGNGTIGAPWATATFAYNTVCGQYDLRGNFVTIQLMSSGITTYSDAIAVQKVWTGGGQVIIQGDSANPSNVVVNLTTPSTTGGNCVYIDANLPAVLTFSYMKFQASAVAGASCISMNGRGTVFLNTVEFGANTTGFHVTCAQPGAVVQFTGASVTIVSGGAQYCIQSSGGVIQMFNNTFELRNRPAFGAAFCYATGPAAKFEISGVTFRDQNAHPRLGVTGTLAIGSPTITVLPGGTAAALSDGMAVTGTGVPPGANILSRNTGANTVTMTANATVAGATALKFEIATGSKFKADLQGLINTFGAGADVLPGNAVGTVNAGQFALYV